MAGRHHRLEGKMTNWAGLSLITAAVVGLVLVSSPNPDPAIATPFWQLHGAAPAAGDTAAVAALRQAARQPSETLVATLR
jgi:hypothetical protein